MSSFKQQGLLGKHTAGNPTFEGVGFVVRELEETLKRWGELLNLTPSDEFIDEDLHARCQKLALPGTQLLFCTPIGNGSADKVLKERGETPFLVNLSNTNQDQVIEMVNGYWRFQ